MRITIFSDIHGNYVALDAILADLRERPTDAMVCLGDAIQGGPQPAETVARLREIGCPIVMGNADAWLLTGEDSGAEAISERQIAVREWSLSRLSPEDRTFIAGFHPTIAVELGDAGKLLCFHGSPGSFDDVLLPATPEDDVRRLLGGHTARFLTGGHTHLQQVRRVGEAIFFNPGSVGLAYSHHQPEGDFHADPWAEYAILTVEGDSFGLEFRRVPFDVAALLRAYRESGRPHAGDAIAQYEPAH
jgi:predicted phosphodiesterase